jgi:hypothetical protein
MTKTKILVTGAFLVGIAVAFQIMPVLFTEALVFLTMFSALPIYIVARLQPRLGFAGFIAAALVTMLFSVHEALFFLCTNGPVGLSLGITRYYTPKNRYVVLISGLILSISLCIMNYGIGIPVFGTQIPGSIPVQLTLLIVFSTFYSLIYCIFAEFVYKRLNRAASLNK